MERAQLEQIVLGTGVAEKHGGFTFLCDPQWTPAQRAAFVRLTQSKITNRKSKIVQGWLCIPTGGTGGILKFARHDERTLTAAVEGFCQHFGLAKVNAVGVLPLHHVSGLMSLVRCRATDGRYVDWNWKKLESGRRPALRGGPWVISLVSTQLQRLLESKAATAWLRRFQLILLGGGPVWPELADAAARAKLPIALTYGMTETAAMITALRPAEFLAGRRDCGNGLPHAAVRIGRGGIVRVGGRSLFRGYYRGKPVRSDFATEDVGRIVENGGLTVLGRHDTVIITGGKKVLPAVVEAALRATGQFSDMAVVGCAHPVWGEEVVACYPVGAKITKVAPRLDGLPAYQRPKRYVALPVWPVNAQGKVNRHALQTAVSALGDPRSQRRR